MPRGAAVEVEARRSGAVEKAVEHLQRLIDLRRVLPGESLPPAAVLAQEVGVNRMAVLQALQVLQRDHLVVVRRGRGGARVVGRAERPEGVRLARAVSRREVLIQAGPLREILESGIARLVAARGLAPEQAQEAQELVRDMAAAQDRDVFHALDTRFHELLARATGSRILEALAMALRRDVLVGLDVVELPRERLLQSNREHERLLAAVLRGNPSAAADWAHRHAQGTSALIAAALSLNSQGENDAES